MQISTRTQDWIVDCLDPDIRVELECLNEVFANPTIVKVRCIHVFLGHPFSHYTGIPWCREGHCVATARLQLVRCQLV